MSCNCGDPACLCNIVCLCPVNRMCTCATCVCLRFDIGQASDLSDHESIIAISKEHQRLAVNKPAECQSSKVSVGDGATAIPYFDIKDASESNSGVSGFIDIQESADKSSESQNLQLPPKKRWAENNSAIEEDVSPTKMERRMSPTENKEHGSFSNPLNWASNSDIKQNLESTDHAQTIEGSQSIPPPFVNVQANEYDRNTSENTCQLTEECDASKVDPSNSLQLEKGNKSNLTSTNVQPGHLLEQENTFLSSQNLPDTKENSNLPYTQPQLLQKSYQDPRLKKKNSAFSHVQPGGKEYKPLNSLNLPQRARAETSKNLDSSSLVRKFAKCTIIEQKTPKPQLLKNYVQGSSQKPSLCCTSARTNEDVSHYKERRQYTKKPILTVPEQNSSILTSQNEPEDLTWKPIEPSISDDSRPLDLRTSDGKRTTIPGTSDYNRPSNQQTNDLRPVNFQTSGDNRPTNLRTFDNDEQKSKMQSNVSAVPVSETLKVLAIGERVKDKAFASYESPRMLNLRQGFAKCEIENDQSPKTLRPVTSPLMRNMTVDFEYHRSEMQNNSARQSVDNKVIDTLPPHISDTPDVPNVSEGFSKCTIGENQSTSRNRSLVVTSPPLQAITVEPTSQLRNSQAQLIDDSIEKQESRGAPLPPSSCTFRSMQSSPSPSKSIDTERDNRKTGRHIKSPAQPSYCQERDESFNSAANATERISRDLPQAAVSQMRSSVICFAGKHQENVQHLPAASERTGIVEGRGEGKRRESQLPLCGQAGKLIEESKMQKSSTQNIFSTQNPPSNTSGAELPINENVHHELEEKRDSARQTSSSQSTIDISKNPENKDRTTSEQKLPLKKRDFQTDMLTHTKNTKTDDVETNIGGTQAHQYNPLLSTYGPGPEMPISEYTRKSVSKSCFARHRPSHSSKEVREKQDKKERGFRKRTF